MAHFVPTIALLAAVLAATSGGAAQSPDGPRLLTREIPFEFEADAGYGGGLSIVAGAKGSVQVSAWRKRSIAIEARIEISAPTEADLDALARAVTVAVEETPTGVEVKTAGPHDRGSMRGVKDFPGRLKSMPYTVEYVVWVPEYTGVEVSVIDGEVAVDGVNGVLIVKSTRGPVRLSNVSGAALVTALDGDVEVSLRDRSWRGSGLDASTARGHVLLSVPSAFSAELDMDGSGGVYIGDRLAKGKTAQKTRLGVGGTRIKLSAPLGKVTVAYTDATPAAADPAAPAGSGA